MFLHLLCVLLCCFNNIFLPCVMKFNFTLIDVNRPCAEWKLTSVMAGTRKGMWKGEVGGGMNQRHRHVLPLLGMLPSETGGCARNIFVLKLVLTLAEIACPLEPPQMFSHWGVVWLLHLIVHICHLNQSSKCKMEHAGTSCGFVTLPKDL